MRRNSILLIAVLSGCQAASSTPSTTASTKEEQQLGANDLDDAQCDEMPSNSTRSNCLAMLKAERAFLEIAPEYKSLMSKMEAADRKRTSEKWHSDIGMPTYKQALENSQKNWVAFREAQCELEGYEWRDGVSQEQRAHQCSLRMNEERLIQIKKMQREF